MISEAQYGNTKMIAIMQKEVINLFEDAKARYERVMSEEENSYLMDEPWGKTAVKFVAENLIVLEKMKATDEKLEMTYK